MDSKNTHILQVFKNQTFILSYSFSCGHANNEYLDLNYMPAFLSSRSYKLSTNCDARTYSYMKKMQKEGQFTDFIKGSSLKSANQSRFFHIALQVKNNSPHLNHCENLFPTNSYTSTCTL